MDKVKENRENQTTEFVRRGKKGMETAAKQQLFSIVFSRVFQENCGLFLSQLGEKKEEAVVSSGSGKLHTVLFCSRTL